MIFATLRVRLRQACARLAPRERRALALLAWVVGIAALIQAAWSLETTRRAYVGERAAASARAEQARALADGWTALNTTPAPARAADVRAEVQRRLAVLGPRVNAEWNADGHLLLRGEVVLATWLEWVGRLQQDQRLVLRRCRITPTGERATIEAQFEDVGAAP